MAAERKPGRRELRRAIEGNLMKIDGVTRDFDALDKVITLGMKIIDDPMASTRDKIDAAAQAREAAMFLEDFRERILDKDKARKKTKDSSAIDHLDGDGLYG